MMRPVKILMVLKTTMKVLVLKTMAIVKTKALWEAMAMRMNAVEKVSKVSEAVKARGFVKACSQTWQGVFGSCPANTCPL